ncbi:ETEC_3214 domain-containing protein [Aliiglaciecola litoralis]|uniref:Uncharacterized protein n=1 Tax=Aliiglaciecola litoralis TaxID=582857 RepID=A0ABN1LRF2_9ALTE
MQQEVSENKPKNINKLTTWAKIQNAVVLTAAVMISAGQWGDTKDLALSAYTAVIENFTHKLQYDLIEKINVGSGLSYIKTDLGEPNVIKRSKINSDIEFHYYNQEKFTLTIMTSNGRVDGYSLLTRVDDFSPQIPFSETLGESTIAASSPNDFRYNFDTGNLVYYVEAQNLGKEKMYLSLIRGFIEYAAVPSSIMDEANYVNAVNDKIQALESQAVFSENTTQMLTALEALRKQVVPNYYAITELDNDIIAESLLTRFEYQTFTKS